MALLNFLCSFHSSWWSEFSRWKASGWIWFGESRISPMPSLSLSEVSTSRLQSISSAISGKLANFSLTVKLQLISDSVGFLLHGADGGTSPLLSMPFCLRGRVSQETVLVLPGGGLGSVWIFQKWWSSSVSRLDSLPVIWDRRSKECVCACDPWIIASTGVTSHFHPNAMFLTHSHVYVLYVHMSYYEITHTHKRTADAHTEQWFIPPRRPEKTIPSWGPGCIWFVGRWRMAAGDEHLSTTSGRRGCSFPPFGFSREYWESCCTETPCTTFM